MGTSRRDTHGTHRSTCNTTGIHDFRGANGALGPHYMRIGRRGVTVANDGGAHAAQIPAYGEIHAPVMREPIVELLAPALTRHGGEATASPVLVDATLGLGGHAEAFLAAFPRLRLVGLDRDPTALRLAEARLAAYAGRVHYVHAIYDSMASVLTRLGIDRVDAVLFDLGVSSLQLDEAERGFAYAQDAPLDMRMDHSHGITAEDVVNDYSAARLARIFAEFGEERFARRVANAIVAARSRSRLTSSAELAELVRQAIPAATRRTGGHPAKRTFQALRIEVNGELDALRAALPAALDALRVGGRIAVLAYHSLEDRIVKQAFVRRSRSTSLPDLPVELPGHAPVFQLLTRGAQRPSEEETAANPRAASARLRAAERIREAA